MCVCVGGGGGEGGRAGGGLKGKEINIILA